jgi:signal transduction histidine kinase
MGTREPPPAAIETGAVPNAALELELERLRAQIADAHDRLRQEIARREDSDRRYHAAEQLLRGRQRLEALGTLAGGVAHEINNCVLPITLYVQAVLERGGINEAAREDLELVLNTARRAKQVVEQVLCYARQPASYVLRRVDLREPVDEALRLIRALASPAIELRSEVVAHCPAVMADPAALVQLVVNLCTNALQAMQPKAGTLCVTLSEHRADGSDPTIPRARYARMLVADSGSGMDRATLEQMFQPFFTTRPQGQGTGLGLLMVQRIVQSMHGLISVSSVPDQGTAVQILFPEAEQPG